MPEDAQDAGEERVFMTVASTYFLEEGDDCLRYSDTACFMGPRSFVGTGNDVKASMSSGPIGRFDSKRRLDGPLVNNAAAASPGHDLLRGDRTFLPTGARTFGPAASAEPAPEKGEGSPRNRRRAAESAVWWSAPSS